MKELKTKKEKELELAKLEMKKALEQAELEMERIRKKISKTYENKCIGIKGFISGHEMQHIFDSTTKPVKADEFQRTIESATKQNLYSGYSNQIKIDAIPKQEVIRVYVHSICTRCGYTVKDDILKRIY